MIRDRTLIPCCECGKGYPPAEMFPLYTPPRPKLMCAACLAKKGAEAGFFTLEEAEKFRKEREPR